ncbi:transcriptional repressor, partial [Lunasporangiospora selenospora]
SFTRSGHLARHIRSHTSEKLFVCPVESCGLGFTRSDALREHSRSHGTRSKSRKACDSKSAKAASESTPSSPQTKSISASETPINSARSSMSPFSMSPSLSETDEPVSDFSVWPRPAPVPGPAESINCPLQQQQQQQQQFYQRPMTSHGSHMGSGMLQTPPYSPPMSPRYGAATAARYASAPYPSAKSAAMSSMMESTYHPIRHNTSCGNNSTSAGLHRISDILSGPKQLPLPLPLLGGTRNDHSFPHQQSSHNYGSDVRLPPIRDLMH